MSSKLTLDDYLSTLWNKDRSLKRLSNPTGKFQFVHFINTTGGHTFMHFTNDAQYINRQFSQDAINDEKKWTVYQVSDYLSKIIF